MAGNESIQFSPPRATGNTDVDQAFQRLKDLFQRVSDRIIGLDQPYSQPVVAAFSIDSQSDVEYIGPGGHTITLPLANSISGKRSRKICIINSGPGTLTVATGRQDTVDGALSVTIATGTFKLFVCNGSTKWFSK